MKIKIFSGLLVIMLLLSSCSFFTEEKEDIEDPIDKGIINVGVIDGGDRFLTKSDGSYLGIEIDIAKEVAGEVKFTEAKSQKELIEMLADNKIDIAAGRFIENVEYNKDLTASRNYGKGGYFLLTKEGIYLDNLGSMEGENVATSENVKMVQEIADSEKVTLKSFENIKMIPEEIREGRIRAAILTEREAISLLNTEEGIQAQEMSSSPREAYVYLIHKNHTKLLEKVNEKIENYLDKQVEVKKEN